MQALWVAALVHVELAGDAMVYWVKPVGRLGPDDNGIRGPNLHLREGAYSRPQPVAACDHRGIQDSLGVFQRLARNALKQGDVTEWQPRGGEGQSRGSARLMIGRDLSVLAPDVLKRLRAHGGVAHRVRDRGVA